MKIELFATGILGTNTYVVMNEETKEAVVIDPARLSKKLREYVDGEQLQVKAILLTHAHFDHNMGIDEVIEAYGQMPVYVEENDLELLHHAELNESTTYTKGYSYDGGDVIHGGDTLELIGEKFQVIHTPGHTAGGVCYYVENAGVVFSGDTLFRASIGRSDFKTSSTSALISSVKDKLFLLPDETIVFPGHMGATKIGFEKEANPFVR